MSWACGWCLAFNDECCGGRIAGCGHGRRCRDVSPEEVARRTAAAREQAMAHARRERMVDQMTARIHKAWKQLDVATDEIVRLGKQIQDAKMADDDDLVPSFERDLLVEKARARGKAEILALLMPPPLDTPEAVGQEAGRRYQARVAGRHHETPGLRLVAKTVLDDVAGRPEVG